MKFYTFPDLTWIKSITTDILKVHGSTLLLKCTNQGHTFYSVFDSNPFYWDWYSCSSEVDSYDWFDRYIKFIKKDKVTKYQRCYGINDSSY